MGIQLKDPLARTSSGWVSVRFGHDDSIAQALERALPVEHCAVTYATFIIAALGRPPEPHDEVSVPTDEAKA
ncbi:MAG: hypothetical protein AAFQ82_05100, partial [Myxococcota bacterium]